MMKSINRRRFLAAAAAVSTAAAFPAPALIAKDANETVRICDLGYGNRGRELTGVVSDPQQHHMKLVGVCDPDISRRESAVKRFGLKNPSPTC